MTQLVQLQKALPAFLEAGYEVFAISNDTVERLADFAQQHDITFSLLSDEDSTVIRAFRHHEHTDPARRGQAHALVRHPLPRHLHHR